LGPPEPGQKKYEFDDDEDFGDEVETKKAPVK